MTSSSPDARAGAPGKVFDTPLRRASAVRRTDRLFFGIGTVAAIWLAFAIIDLDITATRWAPAVLIPLYAVVAYLALPRINTILTSIYVPDYFIGRTRTSDGLLGDPLNLAVRGSAEQLSTAMERAGWVKADPVDLKSSIGIVAAVLARRSYPRAPVSPLVLFDRQQDVAYQQEVDGRPKERHHVRFWRTPQGWPLPGGEQVDWLASGTFDRAVGLSFFTLQVTHRIDADIDVERDHIIATVQRSDPSVTVDVLEDFTTSYHSRNGGGDTIHTDGDLPIVDVRAVTPAPDADPLLPARRRSVPQQIWFPALVNLLYVPFILREVFSDTPSVDWDRWVSIGVVALSVAVVVLSALLLRRSIVARRLLLVVSTIELALLVTAHSTSADNTARMGWLVPAAISVLALIGLSSPRAEEWTGGVPRGDGPEA